MIEYIMAQTPANEHVGDVIRAETSMYPQAAVREVVANALIHQDFGVTGGGPMADIFPDRIEVTNPGEPLIEIERLMDAPPRSRNQALAMLMRNVGICEERGRGIDTVVDLIEAWQLPAPSFEAVEGSTRVTLFAHRPLTRMSKAESVRACYWHAVLKWVGSHDYVTNASVRKRFGITKDNHATASRLLRDAVAENRIRVANPLDGKKAWKYLPWWVQAEGVAEPVV